MARQKWEYAVFYLEFDPPKTPDLLEAIGKEGWEAVSMTLRTPSTGDFMVVLCKRPLEG